MKLKFVHKFSTKISLMTFILLLVSTLLIILYLTTSIRANINDSIDQITYENLNYVHSELNSYISSKVTICELLAQNADLVTFLSKNRYLNTNHPLENVDGYMDVINAMNVFLSKDSNIFSISVWSKNRRELFYQDGTYIKNVNLGSENDLYSWYAYTLDKNNTTISSAYIDALSGDYIFSILTPVKESGDTTGIISINFKIENFPFSLPEEKFILLDANIKIIRTSEYPDLRHTMLSDYDLPLSELLLSAIDKGNTLGSLTSSQNQTFYYKVIPEYQWYLLIGNTKNRLLEPLKSALILTNMMLLISSLIIAIILFQIIKKSLLPLELLHQNIIDVSLGNFSTLIDTDGSDEISESINAFNKMKINLSKLIENITYITTIIHESTSVLADDASRGSNAVNEISSLIQGISKNTSIQVDETQNALFLSKSISTKIDRMIDVSQDVFNKLEITSETIKYAYEALDLLVQNAVVSDLSIRTIIQSFDDLSVCIALLIPIQDSIIDIIKTPSLESTQYELFTLLKQSHQFINELYKHTLDIGYSLDASQKIASTLDFSIEDVIMHCDSTLNSLIDVTNETEQLIDAINSIANRKNVITDSLESTITHSKSTAMSSEEVVIAIENHTLAMKSIEHQISTLYKSSIKLSNQVSSFTLIKND